MNVAKTILQQLGGNRFIAMTGAKHFIAHHNALTFRIPKANGINVIKIELSPLLDTYIMTFSRIHGMKLTEVAKLDNIYHDQLQTIFTEQTGLATHL